MGCGAHAASILIYNPALDMMANGMDQVVLPGFAILRGLCRISIQVDAFQVDGNTFIRNRS